MKLALKIAAVLLLVSAALGQVSVRSYTRKDGTVVSAYTRSAPNRSRGDTKLYDPYYPSTEDGSPSKPTRVPRPKPASVNPCVLADGIIVCNGVVLGKPVVGPVVRDSNGKIKRSETAKRSFQEQAPCPANGKTRGRCPGYVIDHIMPLACGGRDDPSNMQWQTAEDGKAKDKWERKQCGK